MLDDCNSSLQCDVFPSKLFSAFLFLIKSTSRRSALCGWAQTTKQPFIHLTFLSFMNRFLGVALNVCLCASLSVCCQNSTNLCRTVTHHREIWKPHHNFYDLFVYRWIYTWITSCRFFFIIKRRLLFQSSSLLGLSCASTHILRKQASGGAESSSKTPRQNRADINVTLIKPDIT